MSKGSGGRLRLGIAGYGGFGRRLAEVFRDLAEVEIVGVYNRGEQRRRQAVTEGFRTFGDYGEMLASGVDAVAICTANTAHAEQCIAAAQAGKHVFCEKPLALDLDSCDRVVDACRRAGVITHLDMTMRYGPGNLLLCDKIRSGQLGRPLSLWVRRCRGYGLWAAGKRHPDVVDPGMSGGWNIHHNVHGTDFLLHLAGQRAVEVYSKQLRSSPEAPCSEIIVAIVTFADGAVGYVGDSTSIQREDYIGVIGERGSAMMRHGGEFVVKLEDGTETRQPEPGGKGIHDSCIAFVNACRGSGNGRPNVPFEEARHTMEVLLAMDRSATEGRSVRL